MGRSHLPLTPVGSTRRLNRTCGGPARTSGGRHLGRRRRRAVSGERTASGSAARRRLGPRTLQAAAGTSHDHGHGEADLDVAAGRGGRRPSGPPGAGPVVGAAILPGPGGSSRGYGDRGAVPARAGSAASTASRPDRVAPPTASFGRNDACEPSPTSPPVPPRGRHGSARPGRRDPAAGAGLSCVRGCRPATAPGGRAGRPAPGPARRAPSGGPPARAGHPPSARPA